MFKNTDEKGLVTHDKRSQGFVRMNLFHLQLRNNLDTIVCLGVIIFNPVSPMILFLCFSFLSATQLLQNTIKKSGNKLHCIVKIAFSPANGLPSSLRLRSIISFCTPCNLNSLIIHVRALSRETS